MDNAVYAGMMGPWQILIILIFLSVLGLWVKTLIEIIRSKFKDDSKTTWILILILAGLLGVLLYYVVGRKNRIDPYAAESDIIDDEIQ